jgi:hypothetical protein
MATDDHDVSWVETKHKVLLARRNFLELTALAILSDAIPGKAFAVHGNVNSGRERLHERERAPKVEKAVGTAECIRNHCAGEHHCFAESSASDGGGGFGHGVGAVCDDDAIFIGLQTILHDERAIGVGHFKAIDHHYGQNSYFDARPSQAKHLGNMSVLEVKLSVPLVVFLIEGAAGDEDANDHRKPRLAFHLVSQKFWILS